MQRLLSGAAKTRRRARRGLSLGQIGRRDRVMGDPTGVGSGARCTGICGADRGRCCGLEKLDRVGVYRGTNACTGASGGMYEDVRS